MLMPLGSLIPNFFDNKDDWRLYLLHNWHTIVGTLKNRIRLDAIQDTTLIVGVYESHWMQELYLLSQVLMQTINKNLKQPYVTAIRFRLAHEKPRPLKTVQMMPQAQRARPTTLTSEQNRALTVIADDQLKQALAEFLYRCLAE